jgi:hypothetical protein
MTFAITSLIRGKGIYIPLKSKLTAIKNERLQQNRADHIISNYLIQI